MFRPGPGPFPETTQLSANSQPVGPGHMTMRVKNRAPSNELKSGGASFANSCFSQDGVFSIAFGRHSPARLHISPSVFSVSVDISSPARTRLVRGEASPWIGAIITDKDEIWLIDGLPERSVQTLVDVVQEVRFHAWARSDRLDSHLLLRFRYLPFR